VRSRLITNTMTASHPQRRRRAIISSTTTRTSNASSKVSHQLPLCTAAMKRTSIPTMRKKVSAIFRSSCHREYISEEYLAPRRTSIFHFNKSLSASCFLKTHREKCSSFLFERKKNVIKNRACNQKIEK